MAINYENIAKQILDAVGGADNVITVENCMTRLRFTLKNKAKARKEVLEKIEGVKGVFAKEGKYHVVMGSEANDIYKIYVKEGTISEQNSSNEQPEGKTSFWDRIMDTITGSITPIIPIIIPSGLMLVLANLLVSLKVVTAESELFSFLNLIGNAGYYFLPIFIGYFAAKKMNTNPCLGMLLGAILLYPDLSAAIASEGGLHFFGLTIPSVSYSSTIIPILLAVWVLSYVEKFINKILPKMARNIIGPFLTILIMAPLTLLVIGPIGDYFGKAITSLFTGLFNSGLGWIAVGLLGMAFPVIVAAGAHIALVPLMINFIMTKGYDPFLLTAGTAYNMAATGVALAVMIKSKNKELKGVAASAVLSGVMGITEPALYGIAIPLKKTMVGLFAGGLVGGLTAGLLDFKVYVPGLQGPLVLPTYADQGNNLLVSIIVMVVSTLVAFLVTYFRGFDDPESIE